MRPNNGLATREQVRQALADLSKRRSAWYYVDRRRGWVIEAMRRYGCEGDCR